MPRRLPVLLLAILAPAMSVNALDPSRSVTQYDVRVWDPRDGLPQSSAQALAQGPDGYLWIGTQEGLARFDGLRFDVLDSRSAAGLHHNFVTCLLPLGEGLLLGTAGGGLFWVSSRTAPLASANPIAGLSSDRVWALSEDGQGGAWVGSSGGLDQLAGQPPAVTRRIPMEAGGFGARISALCLDREGNLWIGTNGGGLHRLAGGRVERIDSEAPGGRALPSPRVTSILQARDQTVWIGTHEGLARLSSDRRLVETLGRAEGLSSPLVYSLAEDPDEGLWIGTRGGLCRRLRDRVSCTTAATGLADSSIRSLLFDAEGSLWAGSAAGGLHRLLDGTFTNVTTREGLASDYACGLLEEPDGSVLVGQEGGGLHRLRGERAERVDGIPPASSPCSLARSPDGSLWVGTSGDGLFHQAPGGRWRRIAGAEGLADPNVLSLLVSRDGRLWAGTRFGGLFEVSGERATGIGFAQHAIHALAESADGTLHLATNGGGLVAHRPGADAASARRYKEADGLPHPIVLSLRLEPDGSLLAGTNGGGLGRLAEGRLTRVTSRQGLFDDTLLFILDDGRGGLLFSCNRGVFRVDRRELLEAFAGRRSSVASRAWGASDGMRSAECVGGTGNAGLVTRAGRVYLPTLRGVATFDPHHLSPRRRPPPVHLRGLVSDRESVSLTRAGLARIPPGRKTLELRYTATSFVSPERVRFRYRLEGFDEDWVEAGDRRETSFTNLAPGRYVFEVTAAANDGGWNPTGARAEIEVEALLHQRKLFWVIVAAAVTVFGLWLHQLRLQRLEARFAVLAERNRLAGEIHDSLAQGFTGVVLQISAAEKAIHQGDAPPSLAHSLLGHLDRARQLARESLEEARRSVWALRPKVLEGTDLPSAIRQVCDELAGGTTVRLELDLDPAASAAPEIEDELLRAFREALSNALLHAHARHIRVALRMEGRRRLAMSITDDGRGLPTPGEREAGSYGLTSMKARIDRLGGGFTLDSAEGGGTRVGIWVPRRGRWRIRRA